MLRRGLAFTGYQQPQKHSGPEQIELLLDGQRPGDQRVLAQYRSGDRLRVIA